MERIGSTNEKEQMNEQKESKTQAPDEESFLCFAFFYFILTSRSSFPILM